MTGPPPPAETNESKWTRRLAISTAVLAFFTFWVAGASGYQSAILRDRLGEMHQTSDIDRRALELSQGAYVFFYETNFRAGQGINELTKCFENSGNTATKHLQSSV